jgi:hypothetical protein
LDKLWKKELAPCLAGEARDEFWGVRAITLATPSPRAMGRPPMGRKRRVPMRTYRLKVRPSRTAPGAFNAYLDGHLLLGGTRTPLLSGARKLLKRGAAEDDVVELWHEGGGSWALRARVGRAASLIVTEGVRGTRFELWKQWPRH